MKIVRNHEIVGNVAFIFGSAVYVARALGLDFHLRGEKNASNIVYQEYSLLKAQVKKAEEKIFLRPLHDRRMHGVFYKNMIDTNLSTGLTFVFLRSSGLMSGTEGFKLGCQDGVIPTLDYCRRIMGLDIPDISCRVCHAHPKQLGHLLSGCPVSAGTMYIY